MTIILSDSKAEGRPFDWDDLEAEEGKKGQSSSVITVEFSVDSS